MTFSADQPPLPPYQVGYGKPPLHTRFRTGQSGNPGGRPRGMTAGRAKALALKEAYRMVRVKHGDKVISLPAIQAVLRSQIALAAKGNGSAQRAVIEAILAIEQEFAAQAAAEARDKPMDQLEIIEIARSIAFALALAEREQQRRNAKATINRPEESTGGAHLKPDPV